MCDASFVLQNKHKVPMEKLKYWHEAKNRICKSLRHSDPTDSRNQTHKCHVVYSRFPLHVYGQTFLNSNFSTTAINPNRMPGRGLTGEGRYLPKLIPTNLSRTFYESLRAHLRLLTRLGYTFPAGRRL